MDEVKTGMTIVEAMAAARGGARIWRQSTRVTEVAYLDLDAIAGGALYVPLTVNGERDEVRMPSGWVSLRKSAHTVRMERWTPSPEDIEATDWQARVPQ